MRRPLLMSLCLWLLSVSPVLAQTMTTNEPASQQAWEVLLKLAFPIVMTAVGPFVTGYIKDAHPALKYVVASLASMLVGAGAGSIPDFPLGMESAATIGATSGATGQFLYLAHPKTET
ncbi:MAG: hypothetical protein ACREDU_10185 [Methylocella sp.]